MVQKFIVNVIKTAHSVLRRRNFWKMLVSQEIFVNIGLRKISVFKFPEFLTWKILFAFLQKILSMLP